MNLSAWFFLLVILASALASAGENCDLLASGLTRLHETRASFAPKLYREMDAELKQRFLRSCGFEALTYSYTDDDEGFDDEDVEESDWPASRPRDDDERWDDDWEDEDALDEDDRRPQRPRPPAKTPPKHSSRPEPKPKGHLDLGGAAKIVKPFRSRHRACASVCSYVSWGIWGDSKHKKRRSCHNSGEAIDIHALRCNGRTHGPRSERFRAYVQCMRGSFKVIFGKGKHTEHAHVQFKGCRKI